MIIRSHKWIERYQMTVLTFNIIPKILQLTLPFKLLNAYSIVVLLLYVHCTHFKRVEINVFS